MAGKESTWNAQADNGLGFTGMFQIGEAAWKDVFGSGPNAPDYLTNVFDPAMNAQAAAQYLNLRLKWNIGTEKYNAGQYTNDDLIKAIADYNGESTKWNYAQDVWNCANALKRGDEAGAMTWIGKMRF